MSPGQIHWGSIQNQNSALTPSIVVGYKAALDGIGAALNEKEEKEDIGQGKLCGPQS